MKKILILFCLTLLFSCKSKNVIVEKKLVVVNATEVDATKKSRAHDLGERLLETCNTSRFKSFTSDEATEKVIQNATKERISETCKKINMRNGKYISLNLMDITHDETNDQYIFRYNINYEKKYFKRELTVVVDSDNKVSAISTKEVKPKPL